MGALGCDRVHPWAGIVAGRGSLHTLTIAGPRPHRPVDRDGNGRPGRVVADPRTTVSPALGSATWPRRARE
ncbi:hypothetical protein MILUP08_43058 [Micromonospora lupini str. Lupac 08]|uniref:Uncharacterized protein n=1 Tax=Micromonospora lupini str. Lupac 08 TaxID=1150864 RepID=I0L2T0_9ACTN|nr:hypothetical protein MILUP08_43058 [Micromonospora lupini str. Lupac 08]